MMVCTCVPTIFYLEGHPQKYLKDRSKRNPRHCVEFLQKIIDAFWKCWSQDVLPLLVPWKVKKRNVRVNDI